MTGNSNPAMEMGRSERVAWGVLYTLATLARAPALVIAPRLWAEEASVYLVHAFGRGGLDGVLLVPTSGGPAGYLNLSASVPASLAAGLAPLEAVPWVVLAFALAFQLAPAAVILSGRSRLWPDRRAKLVTLALSLAAPPVIPEVWLNTTNAQVHCGLLALVIAAEDLELAGRGRRRAYLAALAFCTLSGPYTAMLLPAFLHRAWCERTPARTRQAAVVTIGAVAQAALAAWVYATAPSDLGRFDAIATIRRPPWVLLEHVLAPVVGRGADTLAAFLGWGGLLGGHRVSPGFVVAVGASSALVVALALLGVHRALDRDGRVLTWAFLGWSIGTAFLAFRGIPAGRYAVLPGLAWLLAWSALARRGRGGLRRGAAAIVTVALAVGVAGWRVGLAEVVQSPAWPAEVARWRADPTTRLGVAPVMRRGPWRFALASPGAPIGAVELEGADAVRLRSTGAWDERVVRVAGLPPDFELRWHAAASVDGPAIEAVLSVRDHQGRTIASHPLRVPGGSARQSLDAQDLLLSSASPAAIGAIAFRARARGRVPVELRVDRLEVAPPVEGLLDGLLPTPTWPRRWVAGGDRPAGAEATWVLAAESLWRDGDLVYGGEDRARATVRWPGGARGLRLTRGDDTLRYAASPWLAAVFVPWFAIGGVHGMVLLGLILYAGLTVGVARAIDARVGDARTERRGGTTRSTLVAAGVMLASGALIFAFLPQPEVVLMVLLFWPASRWIRGGLDTAGGRDRGALAAGGALGAAATLAAVPATLLGAAIAVDLARRRAVTWRGLTAGFVVAWVALGALPSSAGWGTPRDRDARVFDRRLPRAERWARDFERMGEPVRVSPSGAGERTETRTLLVAAWRFFTRPATGAAWAFLFAWLVLAAAAISPPDARGASLLGVLAVATAWAIWDGAATSPVAAGGALHAAFVPLIPLFTLALRRPPRPGLMGPFLLAALLLAQPSWQRIWPSPAAGAVQEALRAPGDR